MALFECKNVSFAYPYGSESDEIKYHEVLNHIDLSIDKGEYMLLCGPSGSGKTTLLRNLKKSIKPEGERSGQIRFDGEELEKLDMKKEVEQIAYISQYPEEQIVTDKVWHELAFGLENLGYDSKKIGERIAETVTYFGMQSWYRMDTASLSGGQKQLLNLAAVMTMHPKVIIMDEPTAQLDPIAAEKFIDMTVKLNRDLGVTMIISEHRTEQLFAMADRIVLMDQGSIVQNLSPRALAKKVKSEYAAYMPTSVNVYTNVMQQDKKMDMDCPLNVREGRKWLAKYTQNRTVVDLSETEKADREVTVNDNDLKHQLKENIIVIKDLYFKYGKKEPYILENLDLNIEKGKITAIVGGNGAGKTTLLKAIAGVYRPFSGHIKTDKGIKTCMVAQNPKAMFTEVTVLDELEEIMVHPTNLWAKRLSLDEKKQAVNEMLEWMQLDIVKNHHPYDISGGQQQKLAIAKVLLLHPDVLLLDEPTKGLDPVFKNELGRKLKEMCHKKNITIIMISHDLDFCAEYADTAALLFDGKITSHDGVNAFFCSNRYYTTTVNKICSDIYGNYITPQQMIDGLKLDKK